MLGTHRSRALYVCGAFTAGTLVFLACTGDDPVIPTAVADAGDSGTVTVDDAGFDAADRPCDPAKDFGVPVAVAGLATKERPEFAARFTSDERTVVFNSEGFDGGLVSGPNNTLSNENHYATIFSITRPTIAEPFGTPTTHIFGLDGQQITEGPTLTADAQTLFFSHTDPSTNVTEIWTSERAAGSGLDFFPPARAPVVNEAGSFQLSPYLAAGGKALYFLRRAAVPGSSADAFFRAERAGSTLSKVERVPGITVLATTESLGAIVVAADELTAYWSAFHGGANSMDIYVATRSDTSSPFSGARLVSAVNTPLTEDPTYLSTDGCRLYYSSSTFTQTTGGGLIFTSDMYVATKPK